MGEIAESKLGNTLLNQPKTGTQSTSFSCHIEVPEVHE